MDGAPAQDQNGQFLDYQINREQYCKEDISNHYRKTSVLNRLLVQGWLRRKKKQTYEIYKKVLQCQKGRTYSTQNGKKEHTSEKLIKLLIMAIY